MITLPKDEEFSPSSPGSSRSVPFRDDPTETDALLGEVDPHAVWLSSGSAAAAGGGTNAASTSTSHRPNIRPGGGHRTNGRASTTSENVYYPHVASTNADIPHDSEPPPSFAPYHAEYFEVGNEDICSHDPHLNTDGEALYRFILARAQRPPFMRVHIKGSHSEHKTRWVTRTGHDGRSRQELENYTETVTDFAFCIDIKPVIYTTRASDGGLGGPIPIDPIHWSVADHVPAYRGRMVKEVEVVSVPGLGGVRRAKRKAKRKETKAREKWAEEINGRGLPPWCEEQEVDLEGGHSSSLVLTGSMSPQLGPGAGNPWAESLAVIEEQPLRSSKTLRQWADEYCASPKRLKEFVYVQELYGWHMQQIESAIRATILATPYNGNLEIYFTKHRSKIYIRPDNGLSRMLSNKWLKFLSIIFLIFPFIWLFKRFHSRGGGRWEVCGGAYPLKRWVPMEDENPDGSNGLLGDVNLPPYALYEDYPHPAMGSPSSSSVWQSSLPRTPMRMSTPGSTDLYMDPFNTVARTRSSSSRVLNTATGPKKLLGLREGEWFRRWEGAITRAVLMRYQSGEPLPESGRAVAGSVLSLDGY